jgi:hypothetical protein
MKRRPRAYYLVAGVDLRAELERLCRLEALGGPDGELARRTPELRVRRARKRPRSRLGFAVPSEWRISVTTYPGIRPGDAQETLLHELVHLAVPAKPGERRWHGPEFKATLRSAMREAYGVRRVRVRNSYHGAYADALERARARRASEQPADQLSLLGAEERAA